jgi:hypothetical protein
MRDISNACDKYKNETFIQMLLVVEILHSDRKNWKLCSIWGYLFKACPIKFKAIA